MKNKTLLSIALTLSLMPLNAEERTLEQIEEARAIQDRIELQRIALAQDEQRQLEEERTYRKAKEEEEKELRRAAELMAKQDLRVGPEQAQEAKDVLIRVLRFQFRDSYFNRVGGPGYPVLQRPPTADRIVQIMDELEKNLVPSGKTDRAEWIRISNPGLTHEKYSVTLLVPDFSGSSPDYFHGLKVVNGEGDVAEFKLVSKEQSPGWAGVLEDLQTVIAEHDAKLASRPKPMTVAWTMEQASHVIPRMELDGTSLRELEEFYRLRHGCGGEKPVKMDLSLIEDRLDDEVIKMHEKDITWAMVWTRSADAIGCDVVFGEGFIRFVPRDASKPTR